MVGVRREWVKRGLITVGMSLLVVVFTSRLLFTLLLFLAGVFLVGIFLVEVVVTLLVVVVVSLAVAVVVEASHAAKRGAIFQTTVDRDRGLRQILRRGYQRVGM